MKKARGAWRKGRSGRLVALLLTFFGLGLLLFSPRESFEPTAVDRVHEDVLSPVDPSSRDQGENSDGQDVSRERLVRIHELDEEEFGALELAPDESSLRTEVQQTRPDRVLDPGSLRLLLLSPPRQGRPLRFRLRALGAVQGDRLLQIVDGKEAQALDTEDFEDGMEASFSLMAPKEDELQLVFRYSGQRHGREGLVEARFRVALQPPPSYWRGPGVELERVWTKALDLQGFQEEKDPEKADLLLCDPAFPAPLGLAEALNRGKGLLLVAGPRSGLHEDYQKLVPLIALPEAPDLGKVQPNDNLGEGSTEEKVAGKEKGKIDKGKTEKGPSKVAAKEKVAEEGAAKDHALPKASGVIKPKKKEPRKEQLAIVFLLDESGSMDWPSSKMSMAKMGARDIFDLLGRNDSFALITFANRARVRLPMGIADREEALEDALDAINARGTRTMALPGLRKAWKELKKSSAEVRHIVLLTDGEFHDQNTKTRDFEKLVKQMRREGIGLTGMGIPGDDGNSSNFTFLQRLTKIQKGNFRMAGKASEIPDMMVREVKGLVAKVRPEPVPILAKTGDDKKKVEDSPPPEPKKPDPPTAKKPEKEGAKKARDPLAKAELHRHPVFLVEARPLLVGLEDRDWPKISHFHPFEAKGSARVHLAVGDQGLPLLVSAPFGLGRIAVFTASAGGASALIGSPWFPQLAAQTATWLLPSEDQPDPEKGRLLQASSLDILEGDGPAPGLAALVAARLGGTLVTQPSPPIGEHYSEKPTEPLPWLMGLLLLMILGLLADARGRRLFRRTQQS